MDESGGSAVSSNLSKHSGDETERRRASEADKIIADGRRSGAGGVRRSMLDIHFVSFSFRSQSSTDSYETVLELERRSTNARRSEVCINDRPVARKYKPANTPHSSPTHKHDQSCSVGSSCDVSDVTDESMLMSPSQCPPLQVMDRSAVNEPGRTSSAVFTANSTPQKCSIASNESLFSLQDGHMSSNQPPPVAGRVTARTDNLAHESPVQIIHDQMDAKTRIPEPPSDPHGNNIKIQPLPPPVGNKKKPVKPSSSSCCCLCSCKSLSCCCSSSCSCCSLPKCSCSCQMPSCSCCNCSLKWCCSWNCCSKKTCCPNWTCCCPKESCCPSCSNCSKSICCWNWSCWKLFCISNWSCCSKESCCKSWSCCSLGSCCKSWRCCPTGSCCKSWRCCSIGSCCKSWSCCSMGSCCKSWSCCSIGSCCKSWSCCSKGSCCRSWKCCSIGTCCKSWNCWPSCKCWSCCAIRSCCPEKK